MLRLLLIATLVASQGLASLAGTTLCLHSDGGFCVEQQGDGNCSHHSHSAQSDRCCAATPADQPARERTIGIPGCDCTHLAIADEPQISVKAGENGASRHLSSGSIAVDSIVWTAPATTRSAGLESADKTGAGFSTALSFLAPVMLRC